MSPAPSARFSDRVRRVPSRFVFGLTAVAVVGSAGCFNQRSFAMQPSDYAAWLPAVSLADHRPTAIEWLQRTHQQLRHLLPRSGAGAMLTQDLSPPGRPADVFAHFGLKRGRLSSVLFNLVGLMNTAQVTQSDQSIDEPPPDWPGFRDVWIPINSELQLAGRLGLARIDGQPRLADCIVLIPGLLGDNGLWRTRDLAIALQDSGLHVLALELRGYGQTEERYPETNYSYGLLETGDLLAVAEWLQALNYVRDTGLIGFSWGGNQALLVAWEDAREVDDPSVAPHLRPYLRPPTGRPHYRAGVIAFSPVLAFEELLDKLARSWSMLADPVLNRMQAGLKARWARKSALKGNGDLRQLVTYEVGRAGVNYPSAIGDGFRYLRLLPYRGQPAGDKLKNARIPVLIVQGANDPLGSAQAVSDLCAELDNPNVAAIILPGGGHNGFAAYARSYYYNLILHFFNSRPTENAVVAR